MTQRLFTSDISDREKVMSEIAIALDRNNAYKIKGVYIGKE